MVPGGAWWSVTDTTSTLPSGISDTQRFPTFATPIIPDCIVKSYDAGNAALRISVKETESNPFEGAELRHPVGSRRQASIAGKYGGGVFCNLPDGTVCMCSYSYQHEDADFMVGDTVILAVQRYDTGKRQMYGKILSKW